MKHLITISLLLFSFCSFGQTAPLIKDTIELDKIKWVGGPAVQVYNIDSLKKNSPKLYKWMMEIIRQDSIAVRPKHN